MEFILTWIGLGQSIPLHQSLAFGPFLLNSGFVSSQRSSAILRRDATHPQVCLCKLGVKDYSDNLIIVSKGLDSVGQIFFLLTSYSC